MNAGLFSIAEFFHSLLRWGVLITVAMAGLFALRGYLRREPIIGWHRAVAMVAMVFCHLQLVVGALLYGLRFKTFQFMPPDQARFWKMEHLGMMIIAIVLVTIGHSTSKRAHDEQKKQLRIAVYYLIALLIFVVMIPWPFTANGAGRGWL
ncbi:MAG TPA: hypothetical protein VGE21_01740 [Flavobacteriales bacterium]